MSYDHISGQTWQPVSQTLKPDEYLWYGYWPATDDDIEEIKKYALPLEAKIHEGTLVGRLSREWQWEGSPIQTNPDNRRSGGINSRIYEHQYIDPIPDKDALVPDNVRFTTEPIWYYNEEGKSVKDIPPNSGAYHMAWTGVDAEDAYLGPRPDSEAEKILGDGEYVWDEEDLLWRVSNG